MKETAFSPRRNFVPGGRCGAYARRRADAKLVKALDLSVRTSDKALKDVERLKRQRRRLARHLLEFRDRVHVATTIIEAVETRANNTLVELVGSKRVVLRLQEENEHLRAEAFDQCEQFKKLLRSANADTQSILDENWELVKQLRQANHEVLRLKSQRRILSIHLREALVRARRWNRLCAFLDSEASSVWYPFNVWAHALARAWARMRVKAEWIALLPFFGRRGASDVQEALNHG